jgi:hypothetical protein
MPLELLSLLGALSYFKYSKKKNPYFLPEMKP